MKRKKVEVDGIIQIKRGKKIDTWIHPPAISKKMYEDIKQTAWLFAYDKMNVDIPSLTSKYPTGVWGG
jgi:hypothetical protein